MARVSVSRRMQRRADDGEKRPQSRRFPDPETGKMESVHLAPTLLRERRGDLTVGGGLRAESQRLI